MDHARITRFPRVAGGQDEDVAISRRRIRIASRLLQRLGDPSSERAVLQGDDLSDLIDLLSLLARADDRADADGPASEPLAAALKATVIAAKAKAALHDRRRRIPLFGAGLFGEAGWDLLLALCMFHEHSRQNIARLTSLIGAAPTTVLRWLNDLEQRGLVRRTESPTDRRVAYVSLTEKGRSLMELYLLGTDKRT